MDVVTYLQVETDTDVVNRDMRCQFHKDGFEKCVLFLMMDHIQCVRSKK